MHESATVERALYITLTMATVLSQRITARRIWNDGGVGHADYHREENMD